MDIAVAPIPSAGGQPAQPFVGVQGFFVSRQSENPLLANDFLVNYLSTEDAQDALYEAGDRLPALTPRRPPRSTTRSSQGFGEAGATGVPMPSIPAMGSVWAFWGATEAQIISGQAEPGRRVGQDGRPTSRTRVDKA